MKVKVSKDLCCGARLCSKTALQVYKLDKLGYNDMDGKEVPTGLEEAARNGAKMCPEGAIQLID